MNRARLLLMLVLWLATGCQGAAASPPEMQPAAETAVPDPAVVAAQPAPSNPALPPTFTPPATAVVAASTVLADHTRFNAQTPSPSAPIPTNTPVTPSPTPLSTPVPTYTGTLALPAPEPTLALTIKPFDQYAFHEIMPYQAFPRPVGDNGWGMHWIPTPRQAPGVVDRFVAELARMHVKWVVFLQEVGHVGDNDYLVEQLVANGIMPVMRLYQPTLNPYGGDVGALVAHYRAKGVYYYQIYNEPNVNVENTQSFANPNRYALAWAITARQVVNNGGLPGLGALSPGGEYNHYEFLDRTLSAIKFHGDENLLNHAWLSVHNYHGLRAFDDPDGFLLFRTYDEIVRKHLRRSLPMIGTEGGSYSPDTAVATQLLAQQYSYMGTAEPYYFAFSYWLLANQEGGSIDDAWEWQALFRRDFVHPVVTEFFYRNTR
jgi:hypothetical protein